MNINIEYATGSANGARLVEQLADHGVSAAITTELSRDPGVIATLSGHDGPPNTRWFITVIAADEPRARVAHLDAGASDCVSWPAVTAQEIVLRLGKLVA